MNSRIHHYRTAGNNRQLRSLFLLICVFLSLNYDVTVCAQPAAQSTSTSSADKFIPNGDPIRGEQLFSSSRASCSACHTRDGRGGKFGPDLRGVADKFDHDRLLRAVLQPSADILPGYELTEILTADGRSCVGIVKFANEHE